MPGGVGGAASRGVPLSRSNAPGPTDSTIAGCLSQPATSPRPKPRSATAPCCKSRRGSVPQANGLPIRRRLPLHIRQPSTAAFMARLHRAKWLARIKEVDAADSSGHIVHMMPKNAGFLQAERILRTIQLLGPCYLFGTCRSSTGECRLRRHMSSMDQGWTR